MRGLAAVIAAGVGIFTLGGGALAVEDLEKGKSAAELFAKDCALCHKTPQAVVKDGAPGEGFLRQHYTSSRETAATLAAYLRGIKPAAGERGAKPKSAAKPAAAGEANPKIRVITAGKPKSADGKPKAAQDAKAAGGKPEGSGNKPADIPSDKNDQSTEKKE
jgi:hypothetical protein